MKKILMLLIVVVGVAILAPRILQWHGQQNEDAQVISHPIYAEARVKMDTSSSSIEGVMLAQTTDQADCEKHVRIMEQRLTSSASICPTCKLQTPECKAELAPRYVKIFENKPAAVDYLSLARGDPSEREIRLIYWGVTVEQSDKLCSAVSEFQKTRKGAVTCVRAPRQ